jgi:hypothetical protein
MSTVTLIIAIAGLVIALAALGLAIKNAKGR